MRGGGATYNTLYADDSDDDSDGFGCVFPKDGAGFDTDSDGSDFSNLADDLYEKASVDSFEFEPLSAADKANGSGYNRAKLDMDRDDVSVGSDTEFQRASKSNKKWDWVEEDEESVGSDSDFEVQFEGRTNAVYDLKAGQGEVEDFLGGGGGEDTNEDFEFHTDFADRQRADAFFNEGQAGVRGSAGGRRGGELVETEYLPAKAGAAQRRRVDPKFIASTARKTYLDAKGKVTSSDPDALIPAPKSSGKSKSAALVAAGLAQAAVKKGGKTKLGGKVESKYGDATEAEALPLTSRDAAGNLLTQAPSEVLDELLTIEGAQADAETQAQAKGRIDRSLAKLKEAFTSATDEAGREVVEERLLSELEDIGDDIRKGLRALERQGKTTDKNRIRALTEALAAIEARMDAGLSPAGMIQAAKQLMILEYKKDELKMAKYPKAEVEEVKSYQQGGKPPKARGIETAVDLPVPTAPAAGKVVGEVELVQVISPRSKKSGVEPKRPMFRIKFAESSVAINDEIGLDKLESLLKGVKGESGAKVDADAKKEIIRRLKRAISEKKLALGLRQKKAPSGFLKVGGAAGK